MQRPDRSRSPARWSEAFRRGARDFALERPMVSLPLAVDPGAVDAITVIPPPCVRPPS